MAASAPCRSWTRSGGEQGHDFVAGGAVQQALPVVGLLDDAAIFPAMVWGITCLLPAAVRRDSEHRIKQMDAKLPYILAFAATLFFLWVAIVVWGIYSLIFK